MKALAKTNRSCYAQDQQWNASSYETGHPRHHRGGSAARPRAGRRRGWVMSFGCSRGPSCLQLTCSPPQLLNSKKSSPGSQTSKNLISGARRCTKVHGGVLRSPGSPPLGGLCARFPTLQTRKPVKFWCSFGASFHPAGRLGRLALPGARPKGVTNRDKTRQNTTKRDIPGSGDSESLRSALAFFSKTVRCGAGFAPVPVRKLGAREFHFRSSEVTFGHSLWSSPRAWQGGCMTREQLSEPLRQSRISLKNPEKGRATKGRFVLE